MRPVLEKLDFKREQVPIYKRSKISEKAQSTTK